MTKSSLLLVCIYFISTAVLYSQKEAYNWYFANNCALSFSTNPPTILSGSAMNPAVGSGASVSDKDGNLLFYTNGMTVWNRQNNIMANGTGLGGSFGTQQALAVKQPGNNKLYYIFTNYQSGNSVGGFRYSIVDMALAAGLGSVTSLNNPLLTPGTEKLTATKHCNGTDVWIVTHEPGNNNFLAYLLTSAGINTVPVVSTIGPGYCSSVQCGEGTLKFNTFGSKLVDAALAVPVGYLTLYDFDKATGIISNSLSLSTTINAGYTDFSSDGSKLYASVHPPLNYYCIVQWDLCAGSESAINASKDTIGVSSSTSSPFVYMQLGPDSKIYISRITTSTLAVINSPNLAGTACNFSEFGQNVGTSLAKSPPNFVSNWLQQAFTYTAEVSCSKASFSAPLTSCMQSPAITGYFWDFGDPASGQANTTNTINPSHNFSAGGIYTVTSVISYSTCAADTFKVEVTISPSPQLTVSGKQVVCKNESTIITAAGANTFSWSTGATTSSISLTPTITTVYSVSGTNTTNLCTSYKTITVTVNPCIGIYEIEKSDWLIGVYPNPHQDNVTVELKSPARATVLDYMGREIRQEELVVGKNILKLNENASGIYFLKLVSEKNSMTLKLVKE